MKGKTTIDRKRACMHVAVFELMMTHFISEIVTTGLSSGLAEVALDHGRSHLFITKRAPEKRICNALFCVRYSQLSTAVHRHAPLCGDRLAKNCSSSIVLS